MNLKDLKDCLPDSWAEVSLGEVLEYVTSGSRDWSRFYSDHGAVFIRTQDINTNQLVLTNVARVSLPEKVEGKRTRVFKGDLLVTITGANVGKVALVEKDIEEAYVSQSVALLRLRNADIGKFLYYQLICKSDGKKSQLETMAYGLGRPVLNLDNIREVQIKLAPMSQQTRIVAEIEKQFSRLDEAVANLKRVKANLKRYKAAVLKAAVEGKLTEEWRRQHPDVETADKLLERILAERRKAAGKGKYKEPVSPDSSGLPGLPAGWVWSSFEQVCESLSDEGKKLHRSEYLSVGRFPVIDQGEQYVGGYSDDERIVYHGSLPVILFGDHTRRFKYVSEKFVVGADGVKIIGIPPQCDSKYLWFQFMQLKFEDRGYSRHFQFVRQEPLAFPPLAEQHQIVAEVERRLSIVAGAEAQVDANLRRADHLRQSILKQAFSGQLVPQDQADEPASVLLGRIRANDFVGAQHAAPRSAPKTRTAQPRRAQHAVPLQKTTPATPDFASLDAVLTAILGLMQPGQDYSRAELADPLGLSTGRWNAAIQELKRRGKVRQMGERRAATYSVRH